MHLLSFCTLFTFALQTTSSTARINAPSLMPLPQATLVENLVGAAKHFHSLFFHVFENCFGPPGAGELRFEQIPRNLVRALCCKLGPRLVRRLTPQKWIDQAARPGAPPAGIKHWLPLQVANYGTWPRYVSTVRYPPPPAIVAGPQCRVTYYGHSSVLIQTQESNVMVDPYFGSHYGPHYVMGKVQIFGWGSRLIE